MVRLLGKVTPVLEALSNKNDFLRQAHGILKPALREERQRKAQYATESLGRLGTH
jgi:hypothetical protein